LASQVIKARSGIQETLLNCLEQGTIPKGF